MSGSNLKETETDVYFWDLEHDHAESIPAYSQNMQSVHNVGTESVVNAFDGRTPVDRDEYQKPGGKYRGQATWCIATGWLAANDLVVTAGHCAFDHAHGLGHLAKAKAYIGYTGKESIGNTGEVEFRRGVAVATTAEWVTKDGGDERRDVSFIKLQSPFSEVTEFYTWEQTPVSQNAAHLGIVGYPGDIVDENGEKGAKMYQMFKHTNFNLMTSYSHMLQYQIDTYGGNSGSPVFRVQNSSLKVNGVHVLGGYAFNSASVIGGNYGNRLSALKVTAKKLGGEKKPEDATQPDAINKKWLWKCKATTEEADESDPVKEELDKTIKEAKNVSKPIPGEILDHDSSISFGQTAGPQIGILASAAIATAGRLTVDSANGPEAESLATTRAYDGILSRAILAETALQHFLNSSKHEQEALSTDLGPLVAALKPFVLKISPKILHGILEPSMRLLLSDTKKPDELDKTNKREPRPLAVEKNTGLGRKLTENEKAFLDNLMGQVNQKETESFYKTFATIGDVIGGAFKKAGPVLLDMAKVGLPLLLGTESAGPPPDANHTKLDPLAHRAILAEACLQTYIAKGNLNTEGIFSDIIAKLTDLGPKMLKTAPFIVKHVGPLVAAMLRERNTHGK